MGLQASSYEELPKFALEALQVAATMAAHQYKAGATGATTNRISLCANGENFRGIIRGPQIGTAAGEIVEIQRRGTAICKAPAATAIASYNYPIQVDGNGLMLVAVDGDIMIGRSRSTCAAGGLFAVELCTPQFLAAGAVAALTA